MLYDILGSILELLGTLSIAYIVFSVHQKLEKEHRLDGAVFKQLRRERTIVVVGMAMIIAGVALQIYGRHII